MTSKTEQSNSGDGSREDNQADKLGNYLLAQHRAPSETTGPAMIDLGKLGIRPVAPQVEDPAGQLALIERDGTPVDHIDDVVVVTSLPAGYHSWREYALRRGAGDQQESA